MNSVSTYFSEKPRPYTGVELRPHFLLTELELKGSAIGAFIGPCLVKTEHLVDWEDRLANDSIAAKSMIHFIGEFFGATLAEGVLLQRLFMASMGEILNENLDGLRADKPVTRVGDDLFWTGRKLSVSIVTASPVSVLLHAGINIDPKGAPVPAVGLEEMGLKPATFIGEVLRRFKAESEDILWACAKVRPVM
jgi:hypothetical protein